MENKDSIIDLTKITKGGKLILQNDWKELKIR